MGKANNLGDFMTDLADAIREKTGTAEPISPQDFSQKIKDIKGGGGGGEDVIFRDYDGTILHQFSKSDFLALTELPPLPEQSGLTCQGWNWELTEAKNYVSEIGYLEVGANYITNDGKTRIYVTIADPYKRTMNLYLDSGITIDWGDGVSEVTTKNQISHQYAEIGEYVISVYKESSYTLGSGTSSYSIGGLASSTSDEPGDGAMINKVEMGLNSRISGYSFQCCPNLRSVAVCNNGMASNQAYIFHKCYSLKYLAIPKGVTGVSNYSFSNCFSLVAVSFPSSVTDVGTYLFENCSQLETAFFPINHATIPQYYLYGCAKLKRLTIPQSVTMVDARGLYGVKKEFSLPDGLATIGAYAFTESAIKEFEPPHLTALATNAFSKCYSLVHPKIAEGVTSIMPYCFQRCFAMVDIDLPTTLTSLGNYAFSYCIGFTYINLPEGVTSIGERAFEYCKTLQAITLPSTITAINNYAISYCKMLEVVDCSKLRSVPTLGTSALTSSASNLQIIVADDMYDSFAAATNWSSYKSKMVKASEFNG